MNKPEFKEEKIKFLEFKDKKGKTISVAKKIETGDQFGTVTMMINPNGVDSAELITEEEFDKKS